MIGKTLKMAYIFSYRIRKIDVLNEPPMSSTYETFKVVFEYVQMHYYYYSGVVIGMILDNNKFKTWNELLRYSVVGFIVATTSFEILLDYGFSRGTVIFIVGFLGFIGHPAFKHVSTEAMPRIFKAITDRIVDRIKK